VLISIDVDGLAAATSELHYLIAAMQSMWVGGIPLTYEAFSDCKSVSLSEIEKYN
jgi:hypothetical protein